MNRTDSSLRDLFGTIKSRWPWILISTLLCGGLAAGWSFLQIPTFESTATVLIEREHQPPTQTTASQVVDLSPDYYETHFELLKTRRVLEKAAHALGILDRREFASRPEGLESFMQRSWFTTQKPQTSLQPTSWESAFGLFERDISIKPVRGTRLARIVVRSHDPEFAARAANAVAAAYVQINQEVNSTNKEKALGWFSSHLDELRHKVEQAQEALHTYRAKNGVVEIGDRQSVSAQRLRELTTELVKLQVRRNEAESRYRQIAGLLTDKSLADGIDWSKWDDHSEVLSSPLIQTLKAQEIKAAGETAELGEKYGPLHPKLLKAKTELSQLREYLVAEVRKIYRSLKHERDLVVSREAAIQSAIAQQKADVVQSEGLQSQQALLEREVRSAQQVYDTFLTGMKEASLASEFIVSNVVLADPAIPATVPSKPRTFANVVLGLLFGFALGTGLALLRDHWDQSLKDQSDCVGQLPSIAFLDSVPFIPSQTGPDRLVIDGPHAMPAVEAFRSIRASILLSGRVQRDGALLITSPGPSDGKSTLAVNLAIAMAQLESMQVLLIDADLRNHRRPNLLELTDAQPKGLTDYLEGEVTFEEIVHHNGQPNLYLIPPGKATAYPSELLSTVRMRGLLAQCRAQGYFVIIDTPPVGLFSDAAILGSQVDGVVIVVGAGQADRNMCQLAAQKITKAGGTILGAVLQKAATPHMSRYYRYAQASLVHAPQQ
ncbi:MAG: polysaccharide biosynthesis tyrosine autokinase [Nitrospiraceae bacterium]|nr:polysaccharide biosynthesis tyrosine autokinase [Nitrospiraceae bacterium]